MLILSHLTCTCHVDIWRKGFSQDIGLDSLVVFVSLETVMALQVSSVLISDNLDDSCKKILEEAGVKVVTKTGMTKEQLQEEIKGHDGLIVRSGTKVTAQVIKAGKNLKIIGRAGTGVDNIDLDASTEQGIIVMNTPSGNTLSAAELTCSMVMALSRHLPQAHMSLKEGRWDRKKYMGTEVFGKTLAIIGLGRIGREVATRMQSFGMRTIGYDPLVPAEDAAKFGVEFMEIKEMLLLADFITVHVPLIPQTKGLINKEAFKTCKKGVFVINCARGGIIDEGDLLEALNSGQCGGAGLDVFVEEPPKNRALVEHPNVVCTPHLGASTKEAQLRVAKEIGEQIVDAIQGRGYFGIVNAPAVATASDAAAKPWVELVEQLAQLASSGVKKATEVLVTSDQTKLSRVLPVAALTGAMKVTHPEANLVNGPSLAKAAGVTSSFIAGNTNTVIVTVSGEGDNKMSTSGCVCGDKIFLTAVGTSSIGYFLLEGTVALLSGQNIDKGTVAKTTPLSCMAATSDVIVCSLTAPLTQDQIISLKNIGLTVSQVTF